MKLSMLRARSLTCPHGHGPLSPARIGGVPVDYCPACKGEWIGSAVLQGFYPQWIPGGDAATSLPCPRCHVPLRHHPCAPELPVALESCANGCGWWLDEGERLRLASTQASTPRPRLRVRRSDPVQEDHRLAMARKYAVERPRPPKREPEAQGIISPWELDRPQRLLAWLGMPVESGRFFDTRAWMTLVLILVNLAVFAATLAAHWDQWLWILIGMIPEEIRQGFGLWPVRLKADPSSHWPSLLSAMFLHGGLGHLFGNMLFLFMTGDDVELRMGRWRFLAFYLLGGLAADMASLAAGLAPDVPHVGASGAISAVMGAYLILARGKRIYGWGFRFLLWGRMIGYPSSLYMLFWFGSQFAMMMIPELRVDLWAHIGGFVFGAAVALIMSPFQKYSTP